MKVLISGHYGGINLGDDAILCALVETLQTIDRERLSLTALSHGPVLTQKQTGIVSLRQPSFFPSIIKDLYYLTRTIRMVDCLVIGGGGLLQDEFNIKTITRYLLQALIGKVLRKKVILYALGVGPLNYVYSEKLIKWVSNNVDAVSVRDDESRNILEKLGVRGVAVVPDPALRVPKCDNIRTTEIFKLEKINPNRTPKIGVCLRGIYHAGSRKSRSIKPLSVEQKNSIVESLQRIAAEMRGVLVFFCFDSAMDSTLTAEIADACRCEKHVVTATYDPREIAGILGSMDVVISMPLHPAILASRSYVPVVAIAYNPKVKNFMRRIRLDDYVVPMEALNLLTTKVLQIWQERASIRSHLINEVGRLQAESIASLQETLQVDGRVTKRTNLPAILLSGLYLVLGFVPTHLIHKYLCSRS
jgi:polysaccharide pyruvyl transferase CsaB